MHQEDLVGVAVLSPVALDVPPGVADILDVEPLGEERHLAAHHLAEIITRMSRRPGRGGVLGQHVDDLRQATVGADVVDLLQLSLDILVKAIEVGAVDRPASELPS